jgi:hypothetical protein
VLQVAALSLRLSHLKELLIRSHYAALAGGASSSISGSSISGRGLQQRGGGALGRSLSAGDAALSGGGVGGLDGRAHASLPLPVRPGRSSAGSQRAPLRQ